MKNIFDLRAKEKFLREREIELNAKDATYSARWAAKELEKKNEIAEIKALHSKEIQSIELAHKSEVASIEAKYKKEIMDKDLNHSEYVSDLNCVHKEQLSELREELKKELGIKAIELEKENARLEERERVLDGEIDDLRSDNKRLATELREMTLTALKYAEKSAEVKVIDTKVVSPQVIEGKINVIPTCKG